jgi:3-oxoacyl-[acyl-carrier protein] reductase
MDLGIKGKLAFVAASSKGLGKAVAEALLAEGCRVVINGRTEASLMKTKSDLEALFGPKVFAIQGDLSEAKDRNRIIEDVKSRYGDVDVLVTNTGGPPSGKFEDFGQSDWDQAYQLLLGSAVGMINGFLPGMKQQKWGRIIAITSVAVKQPVDNLILSNSVRASVVGLCKSLSNELGEYAITVNNVMPGYTNTERLQKLAESNASFSKVVETIPLKRIGEPAEFGAAVAFLASKQASYITGVSLPIDGGAAKGLL